MLLPSASSLIRQAAIIFLCTSRPQQLRCTLMALLLCPGEDACTQRFSLTNSPDGGLTSRFLRRPAPTWFTGFLTRTIAILRACSPAASLIVPHLSTIFMLRGHRIPVMLTWFRQIESVVEQVYIFQPREIGDLETPRLGFMQFTEIGC